MLPAKSRIKKYTSEILFRTYDLDIMLERAVTKGATKFISTWIRGVGDISMILSEAVKYIKKKIPGAEITFLLPSRFEEAAKWIDGINEIIPTDIWDRGQTIDSLWGLAHPPPWEIKRILNKMNLQEEFDMILPYPMGKWWFRNTSSLKPILKWTRHEEQFGKKLIDHVFSKEKKYVVAVNSSTGTKAFYSYNRDWGAEKFRGLISSILNSISEAKIILVDKDCQEKYPQDERLFDARSKFSISESMSIIANSDLFICLDTGPPNLVYFLEGISLNIIALLGELHSFFKYGNPPASSNVILKKIVGANQSIDNISVQAVMKEIMIFYKKINQH